MNKIKVRILFIFSRHSQSWPSHTAGCSASFTYQPKVLINSNPTAPPYPASCIPPYPTNPAVSHRPAISYRCWRRAERLKVPILQVARNFSQKLRVDIQWEQHIRLVYGVLSGGHRDMESYICRQHGRRRQVPSPLSFSNCPFTFDFLQKLCPGLRSGGENLIDSGKF